MRLTLLLFCSTLIALGTLAITTREAAAQELRVSPNVGGYVGWARHDPALPGTTRSSTRLALWLGGTATMALDGPVSPFGSIMVEVEPRQAAGNRTVTYFMPMAHAGLSITGCHDDPQSWLAATFPCAKIYGIGGIRPAMPGQTPSLRAGIGVNSVFVPIFALMGGALAPSHYEFVYEQDFSGNSMAQFRIGLGF